MVHNFILPVTYVPMISEPDTTCNNVSGAGLPIRQYRHVSRGPQAQGTTASGTSRKKEMKK